MPKNKNSPNQKEKKRQSDHERIEGFNNKKEAEKLEKGMEARAQALQTAGMSKQEDNFVEHAKIYNYADDQKGPPIDTIDAPWQRFKCCGCYEYYSAPYQADLSFCPCGYATRGEYDSEDSMPPSPKPSRKRESSPCPSSFKFKHDPRALQAARNRRAAKVFEKSMETARKAAMGK
jgi:hypothetical protein